MARYVDVEKFREAYGFGSDCDHCKTEMELCMSDAVYTRMNLCEWFDFMEELEEDVAPVERGHWEPTESPFMAECVDCSKCGYRTTFGNGWNYCPQCGARMEADNG